MAEPSDFRRVTTPKLAMTLSKVDDPCSVGIRDLVVEIQAQLRQGERKADKNTRLANVTSEIKDRKATGDREGPPRRHAEGGGATREPLIGARAGNRQIGGQPADSPRVAAERSADAGDSRIG